MPELYDAVAYGMWTYSHAAFRVETLGRRRFRLEPGTLIVVTHRRETDVPVLSPPLYFGAGLRRNVGDRMSFAARDDMFLPGFFAGFPEGLPGWTRRLLHPVGVGRWLPVVRVYPITSANVARLGEVLRARPEEPLEHVAPPEAVDAFRARGLAPNAPAREALQGNYADLLWRPVTPREVPLDGFWNGRAARAARDFRTLVELLRSPASLVVFPEGRPSPDGEIGPLRPGIGALVRRGRPSAVRPIGLAYDPLVRGRTRVFVALPDPVPVPESDVEQALLALMRSAVPLTAGQFAAHRLEHGADADPAALERELAEEVETSRRNRRPVERELLGARGRRRRLAEALAVAPRKPAALSYLAREFRSAREPPAG